MIALLEGTLHTLTPQWCIILVQGVGYLCHIPLRVYKALHGKEKVALWIHTHVRDNGITLYGFLDKEDREMFQHLISINGVGPRVALNLLSTQDAYTIGQIIRQKDEKRLSQVPGIGLKTARRIIMEFPIRNLPEKDEKGVASLRRDALSALENLGLSLREGEAVVDEVLRDNPDIPLENLIVETLKRLGA